MKKTSMVLLAVAVAATGLSGQGFPAKWIPTLNSSFVRDTLNGLVARPIVFVGDPIQGAAAQQMHNDTIKLGAFPEQVDPEYILAHEVGHTWSEQNRTDTAVYNILLLHDAQEKIGGYAAKSVGEHAAEAFAYAVLILRMPVDQQAAMLQRVESMVLGTTLVYERIKSRLTVLTFSSRR